LLRKQLSGKYKVRRKRRLLGSQDGKLPKLPRESRKGKEHISKWKKTALSAKDNPRKKQNKLPEQRFQVHYQESDGDRSFRSVCQLGHHAV